jgi:FkbM family methyltransferase
MSKLSVIGKIARLPLKMVPKSAIVTFLWGPLKGMRWITGASNHGYWLGMYERKMKRLLLENVSTGDTFLDLGAHVGYYSLLGAKLVGPKGKVYSFEPLPRNLAFLRKHLELNNISNVVVFEGAIAHFDGFFNLNDSSPVGAKLSEEGKLKVKVFWLKEMWRTGLMPLPQVIKMDIEGAELELLKDIKDILKTNNIRLFLSTHGKQTHRACLAILEDIGYSFQPLDGETVDAATEVLCLKKNA